MRQKGPSILIVDDDKHLLNRLRSTLAQENYEVYTAESGQEAREILTKRLVDLLVLDIVLPDCNGLEEVCKWARERQQNLPIIILTTKDDDIDKLKAFALFATDYVTKPFSMPILLARVKTHLHNHQTTGPVFTIGPLNVDFSQHRVQVNGHDVPIQRNEYQILKILIDNKDHLVTIDTLIYKLWPNDNQFDADREAEVYTYIYSLRKKIDRRANRHFIKTIHLVGYRFQTEEEE